MKLISEFLHDDVGTTAIEYTVIAAVVSIVAIAAFRLIGGSLGGMMDATASSITGA